MPTITIDLTAAQGTRVANAFGERLTLRDANGNIRAATLSDVRGALVTLLREAVEDYDAHKAKEAITPLDVV